MTNSAIGGPLHRAARAAVMLAAFALAAGCSERPERAGDDSAARASRAPVTDSLTGPGVREGIWQGADARSTWRALLDGSRVTQIDEITLFTDSTRAMRQFRYDTAGALASAREEREQLVFGATAKPDTVNTVIDLAWQSDTLARSVKRVNGVDRPLQPYEVDNLRAHAGDLLRTARAGSAPDTPDTTP